MIILNLDAPSKYVLSICLAHLIDSASFSVWLYLFSVSVIVRLIKYTGCTPLSVFWRKAADKPSLKLASVRRIMGLLGSKNAMVFSFEMLSCILLNASSSSFP